MKKLCPTILAALILLWTTPSIIAAGWGIDIETGIASNGYNDVRIPGNTGTDISLTDDLSADETGFVRVRLAKELGTRHRLSFLVAPLRITASGTVDRGVDFNGVQFASGSILTSDYRFDSYRLSYSYTLAQSNRLRFNIGFTAKVRDASIKIAGNGKVSEKTNTGFVPLINFAVDWSVSSKMGILVDGDALAAPQGRAEDVLVALYGNPMEKLRLRLGYRILEGGADNDEVYSFTLVHYLSAGVTWSF